MSNDELYEKALEAINQLFYDESVSPSDTRVNLKTLISEIEMKMDTLEVEA